MILELPDGIDIHALVIFGYRGGRKFRVGKNPLANVVFYGTWGGIIDTKVLPVRKQLKKLIKKASKKIKAPR